jgi:hypothetical protein
MKSRWTTARAAAVMDRCVRVALLAALSVLCASGVRADDDEGVVQLPLTAWQALSRGGEASSARASLGVAATTVQVVEDEGRLVATVTSRVTVRAAAPGAEAVLLPAGVAVERATADGVDVVLQPTSRGLAWIADAAGTHQLEVRATVEGLRYDHGASVGVPLPPAPSVLVSATLPPDASDAAMVPGVAARTTSDAALPSIVATVPGGGSTQLAWRVLSDGEAVSPSRAVYRGTLTDDAVVLDVELAVDLARDAPERITLFPTTLALGAVTVDGDDAPVAALEGSFVTTVSGHGRHTIRARIEVPLDDEAGLASAELHLPSVPISRFELVLPPGKDLRVSPRAAITRERGRAGEIAVFHVPLTDTVSLEWPEALPEELATPEGEAEVRASATLVHVVSADEGVVRATVHATWDIARGAASRFDLSLPEGVDVGTVAVDVATVEDWRISGRGADRVLSVFVDRAIEGAASMQIELELLRGGSSEPSRPFTVPLLAARQAQGQDVWRQSGMLALLATRELVLEPAGTIELARVGENQLPATVRESIEATVAHVFRWTDAPRPMDAVAAPRPHEEARFDVHTSTLLSLGDVTTSASSALDVHVKSGALSELVITLPAGANVLEVSAPSLREHRVEGETSAPRLHLWFTQEMEGDVRVELRLERMVPAGEAAIDAPLVHVDGADVEDGRVAIEATAAVEISADHAEGLSPIDLADLTEDLVLRSSSPILLAFRYAHATPAPLLGLAVARHREVTLHAASIEDAHYTTLVTDDGLAVTMARWTVRNDGAQFLRVSLPDGAEVWSASVAGRAETPALASEEGDTAPVLLLGVIRSSTPFEVQVTYATPVSRMHVLGRVHVPLPRPDLVVSHARWEVYLPSDATWRTPWSDLAMEGPPTLVSAAGLSLAAPGAGPSVRVPAQAAYVVFDDVFVGRDGEEVGASFPYAAGLGVPLGALLALLGALLAWLGLLGLVMARIGVLLVPEGDAFELATYRFAAAAQRVAVTRKGLGSLASALVLGALLLVVSIGLFGASPIGPVLASFALVAGLVLALRRRILAAVRELRDRLQPPAPSAAGMHGVTLLVEPAAAPPPAPAQSPEASGPGSDA